MSVATPTAAVMAMEEDRKLPRALMGGTKAMRAAGREYLPQEIAESDAGYKVRLARSFLFNGYRKTVRDMAGKVFAKPIAVGDDVPPKIAEMLTNIDLAGRDLDVFAHAVLTDAMAEGISYILVDMDQAPTRTLTQEEARRLNRRPWVVHVKARQMIGWRSETIAGVDTLTQVRFSEEVTEADGEFGEKPVKQVRAFTRTVNGVEWSVWREDEKSKEWVVHQSGRTTISDIAFCPVYVSRAGFMAGYPPLADLAEVNLSHWQSQSDQRNILHVARVPILFGSGFESGTPIEIGAGRMVTASDPNAKMQYVEHSGAAIESGRTDLKDLEFQMQTLGLELLIPRPGGQSATGAAIDQAKMHAPLAMMANALQDALEQALEFMARYSDINADLAGTLTVNTDFGVSMRDAGDITALLGAVNAGVISRATFIREMKRRGVIADDVDEDEEFQRVLDEGHPLDDEGDAMAALATGMMRDRTAGTDADAS